MTNDAATSRPVPDLDDLVAAPFWREAGQGRLTFQRCGQCGYVRWPPAASCPECWSTAAQWEPVAPEGTVWKLGVYDRAFIKAFKDDVPYVVALVVLDAGPRMISNVVGLPPEDVTVGMRVTASYEPFGASAALVKFRPI